MSPSQLGRAVRRLVVTKEEKYAYMWPLPPIFKNATRFAQIR